MTISDLVKQLTLRMKEMRPDTKVHLAKAYDEKKDVFSDFDVVRSDIGIVLVPSSRWVKK